MQAHNSRSISCLRPVLWNNVLCIAVHLGRVLIACPTGDRPCPPVPSDSNHLTGLPVSCMTSQQQGDREPTAPGRGEALQDAWYHTNLQVGTPGLLFQTWGSLLGWPWHGRWSELHPRCACRGRPLLWLNHSLVNLCKRLHHNSQRGRRMRCWRPRFAPGSAEEREPRPAQLLTNRLPRRKEAPLLTR